MGDAGFSLGVAGEVEEVESLDQGLVHPGTSGMWF